MAGTWNKQDQVLPGAYINIRTNEPLAITPGERGTVVILQEMSQGTVKEMYEITAREAAWPEGTEAEDKKLAAEALKKAKTVLIYKLPTEHTAEDVKGALEILKRVYFQTLCYPYEGGESETVKESQEAIVQWLKEMREKEGAKCQAVLAGCEADYEGVINVVQGIVLADGTKLTPGQTTAWAAAATASAGITVSNTGLIYEGAVDVEPRLSRTEMEEAVETGKFIFRTGNSQNVSVVYDINSMVTITEEKGKIFRKNRVIRTLDSIFNDLTTIFEGEYVGKVTNLEAGRNLLKAAVADYFSALENMGAIRDFDIGDISITEGEEPDSVVITAAVRPADSVEKIYMTVNLA